MRGLGTIVNVAAIVAGGIIGSFLGSKIKQRFQDIVTQACGLGVIVIGISGCLEGLFVLDGNKLVTDGSMLIILSLICGSVFGEAINIEGWLTRLGDVLKKSFQSDKKPSKQAIEDGKAKPGKSLTTFTEGFVTATMIVSVGAMAICGAMEDGMNGDATTLYIKSILDFVIVMALASSLGIGTCFSAIPVLIIQGLVTILSMNTIALFTDTLINQLSTIGSVLIIAVGLNLAIGKKFKVANMLPSFLIPIIYYLIRQIIESSAEK